MSDLTSSLTTDPELLAGFFDETQETLGGLDALFVKLESAPTDLSVVEAIFRPVHSLKGNSAFFGFIAAKQLAHEMETLLDHVRKGRTKADRSAIDVLLAGVDVLKELFTRLRAGGPEIEDQAAYDAVVKRVVDRGNLGTTTLRDPNQALHDLDVVAAALGAGVATSVLESIHRLRKHIGGPDVPTTTRRKANAQPLIALKRRLSVPFEGALPPAQADEIFKLVEKLRDEARDESAQLLVAEMLDGYRAFIDAMGFDVMLRDFLLERVRRAEEMNFGDEAPAEAPKQEALEPKPTAQAQPRERTDRIEKDPAQKSMRVAEATIDTFLHYVGELLVVGDLFGHLYRRVGQLPNTQLLARDFRRANETFNGLSNKLQKSIMGIRRVPIKPLLQKVPRLVRDVSSAQGKEVQTVLIGEDVSIDKSLIDLLDAPMTHMVRNAADHGIEKPADREAAGKPRHGTITITAQETDASLVLSIEDDGAGLNLDGIRRKGENLGLIAPGAALTEHDIINLIFASGVSTAKSVTDISGRGVGMDVVKRAVEEAGGAITVTSQTGKGSRFQIKLPKGVTTQIMPGYLIRVHGRTYTLPLDRVHETFLARADEVTSVVGRGSCLKRHGVVLPLLLLDELLTGQPWSWPAKGATVVTVMANRRKLAVVVEAVLGVQKVVIRPMVGLPPGADMIAGGALMGDGTVALILNLDRVQASGPGAAHE